MTVKSSTDEQSDGDDPSGELPPQLNGLPLFGSTLDLARDPIGFFDRVAEHGDVVRYEIGRSDFTILLHPDHVEQLLLTDPGSVRKLRLREIGDGSAEFAPEGVLFTEGEQWRNQRTMLQNVFTLDRIERYGTTITDVATRHAESWTDGEELAINHQFSELTLAILTKALFDLTIDGRGSVITDAARAVNEQSDPSTLSTYVPAWIPTPAQRRYDQAMTEFETVINRLIEERRESGGPTEKPASDQDDLLSLLLTAENPNGYRHTETEIQDQLLTFLFAGHETTSLALTYTVLLLTQHPAVENRLHEEWDDVLGSTDPTPSDASDLTYTDHVIRESLRLYPPAFAVFRTATEEISLGGYVIPEETNITIPQFRLHRDPRFYDDPETFDPDRWEDPPERPEYAYFPFGGGPRHCIGMRFAMMELKLVLPTILRRVEFELLSDPDPELAPRATLRPAEDVRTRVRTRSSLH